MQDSIDSLIDVLYTPTLAQDQIEDTCEHAHSKNFSCHDRTRFQRNCNFTDCHPIFSVDSFDHDSAAALFIETPSQKPKTMVRAAAES